MTIYSYLPFIISFSLFTGFTIGIYWKEKKLKHINKITDEQLFGFNSKLEKELSPEERVIYYHLTNYIVSVRLQRKRNKKSI